MPDYPPIPNYPTMNLRQVAAELEALSIEVLEVKRDADPAARAGDISNRAYELYMQVLAIAGDPEIDRWRAEVAQLRSEDPPATS